MQLLLKLMLVVRSRGVGRSRSISHYSHRTAAVLVQEDATATTHIIWLVVKIIVRDLRVIFELLSSLLHLLQ